MIEFEINSIQKNVSCGDFEDQEETRYIIVERGTEKLLDDAQGYGYKSVQAASKAGWYKFKGGKEKISITKKKALTFWSQNPDAAKDFNSELEYNFKELARDEISIEEITVAIEERYNIIIPRDILKYLDLLDSSYRKKFVKTIKGGVK